jgi:hypothetical protein
MWDIERTGITLAFGVLLTMALSAAPLAVAQSPVKADTQLQTTSGNIVTVQKRSFTLITGSTSVPGAQIVDDGSTTMMFVIDGDTAINGKLRAGVNADVAYRKDTGNNIAVSVTIRQ